MLQSLFDLSGRIALVTGSSRGIGLALARGLSDAGATVVLNGRDREALEHARATLLAADSDDPSTGSTSPGAGARRVAIAPFDVTQDGDVAAGVARVEAEVGPIQILVNNTGIQRRAPLVELALQDWQALVDTNLSGTFFVSRHVAAQMIGRRRGKIITVCSVQSALARPGIAAYAATKGALKMLTQGMCADLGPLGIQANGLAPGYIETDLTQPLVTDEEFTSWVQRRTPAGRWGTVHDLVGAAVFLAAPASDFVNGQILYVDGGMTAVV